MTDVQHDLFGNPTATIKWKGDDDKPKRGIQVMYDEKSDCYTLVEFRKTGSKDTKLVYGNTLVQLRLVIHKLLKVGDESDYKPIIGGLSEALGLHNQEGMELSTFISVFNGGVFRAKYYFPLLYYPLKVLSYLGEVEHRQGRVRRLK